MTTTLQKDARGLAGQTIGDTGMCSVNQTSLIYRGYEIGGRVSADDREQAERERAGRFPR